MKHRWTLKKGLKKPKRNTKMVDLRERFRISTDFEIQRGFSQRSFIKHYFCVIQWQKGLCFFQASFWQCREQKTIFMWVHRAHFNVDGSKQTQHRSRSPAVSPESVLNDYNEIIFYLLSIALKLIFKYWGCEFTSFQFTNIENKLRKIMKKLRKFFVPFSFHTLSFKLKIETTFFYKNILNLFVLFQRIALTALSVIYSTEK